MKDKAEVYGLVLAGGRSSRMGFDKGLIRYHEIPHRQYLYHLLDKFCVKTFMGLRPEQQEEADGLPCIPDNEAYLGPFRSILSAHESYPAKAWLVLACDLPFIKKETIARLFAERDPGKAATAFMNHSSGFLEPLVAIWEPESLQVAKAYGAEGGKCPRKFLMSQHIKRARAADERELMNANFPADYQKAKEMFN